jgi:hypothetical protein
VESHTVDAANGQFTARFAVPAEIPWEKLVVRAILESSDRAAQGTLLVPVAK